MMTLHEFQAYFEGRFFGLLEEKAAAFMDHSNYDSIKELLSYLTVYAKGGKRFRPYMAYIGYTTEGGEHDIFPLLASVELLHLFCLVHDDIIDAESLRHESPTLQVHYQNMYNGVATGRAVALLVGDLLLAWSVECLHEIEPIEPYTIDDAAYEYRETLKEVIHGQMLDVILSVEETVDREMIERTMIIKSAHYSFFRPLYLGMVLAGADPDTEEFAAEYATNLGLAFQTQDDLDDVVHDMKHGQQTLITSYMQTDAEEHYQKTFQQQFGQLEWTDADEEKLLTVLRQSGALSYAEECRDTYFLKAEDAIFNYDKNGEEIWQDIIDAVRSMSR